MEHKPVTCSLLLVSLLLTFTSIAQSGTTATKPRVDFATYLSGSQWTEVTGAAVDSRGYLYLTGYTWAADFPTTSGAYLRTPDQSCDFEGCQPQSSFVVKLARDGRSLVYSTYLKEHRPVSIAVDAAGNTYIVGERVPEDYTGTAGAWRTQCNTDFNNSCNWLVKLNASGSALIFSTALHDTKHCFFDEQVAINSRNEVYVAGKAYLFDPCPGTPNAFLPAVSGTDTAVQVMKFSADGKNLLWSTFVSGGTPRDEFGGLAVDRNDHAIVAGTTLASFPTTLSAYQRTRRENGGRTPFVSKLSSDGTRLLASTLIGLQAEASSVAVDRDLNVYVAGLTYDPAFPTTPGAYRTTYDQWPCGEGSSTWPCTDMFVTKLPPNFGRLTYSTLFGAQGDDNYPVIALDPVAHVYLATNSGWGFPLVKPVQTENGNLMVAKFSIAGNQLLFSSPLGGPYQFSSYSGRLVVDLAGNAYLAGATASKDFAVTPGAFQTENRSDQLGGYAMKVDVPPCTLSSTVPSITICAPASGATVRSPVVVAAGATDDVAVHSMALYLDGVKTYTIFNASHFETRVSLSAGTHAITVKAWDSAGRVISRTRSFTAQ